MLLYASVRRYIFSFWEIESSATFKLMFQKSLRNDKLLFSLSSLLFRWKLHFSRKIFSSSFVKYFSVLQCFQCIVIFIEIFWKERFPEVEGGLFTLKPDQWPGKENRKRALSNHWPESCNRSIRIKFFSLLLILYT